MNMKKGGVGTWVLVIIVIILIIIGIVVMVRGSGTSNTTATSTPTQEIGAIGPNGTPISLGGSTVPVPTTAGWLSYGNVLKGFSFLYPPALSPVAGTNKATFAVPFSNASSSTAFDKLNIVVAVASGTCEDFYSSFVTPAATNPSVAFTSPTGSSFTYATSDSGSTSAHDFTDVYATYQNNNCYAAELTGEYNESDSGSYANTLIALEGYDAVLRAMAGTFKLPIQ